MFAENLQTAAKLTENKMPTLLVDECLRLVSGTTLSSDSIKSLRQSVMHSKHSEDGTHGTAAQKLIHSLQTTENHECLMLYYGYAKAMDKVRVTNISKSKGSRESVEDVVNRDEEIKDQMKNVVSRCPAKLLLVKNMNQPENRGLRK